MKITRRAFGGLLAAIGLGGKAIAEVVKEEPSGPAMLVRGGDTPEPWKLSGMNREQAASGQWPGPSPTHLDLLNVSRAKIRAGDVCLFDDYQSVRPRRAKETSADLQVVVAAEDVPGLAVGRFYWQGPTFRGIPVGYIEELDAGRDYPRL